MRKGVAQSVALASLTALAVALVMTPLGTGATSKRESVEASKAQSARGPRGPRGKRGFRGPRGFRGFLGAPGATGQQGIQGPQGVQGPSGLLSSADEMQGLPCTQKDKPGVVITARTLDPQTTGATSLNPQCAYADGYEPNNTRSEESDLPSLIGIGMSIFPANEEDWLASSFNGGASTAALYFTISGGIEPTMDVYRDTVLVASGVSCASGVLTPGVHDYEVRVVGAGAASYVLSTSPTCPT